MTSASQRIFLDLEYCYPGMTPEKGRPGDSERRKVIQISAISFDARAGKEMDAFDVLVKPIHQSKLPRFFTTLTGITNQMVRTRGIHFEEALEKLLDFCGNHAIWTFNADWSVLRQNCGYFSMSFPFECREFSRVKERLPSWGINPNQYSSGTLYQAAGLKMNGRVHNALHDVRSMAHAVHHFENLLASQSR